MPPCPACQQPATKRNGFDRRSRQKYACSACQRTFTDDTASAFSGYRWPAEVILTAVRWYLAYPLSSRQVLELLAERGIDVSHRTVLNWVQTFGPQLAAAVRRRRHPVGTRWFVDEVFLAARGTDCISTVPSTKRAWSSTSCSAGTATRPVRRPSFARRSSAPG